MVNPQAMRMTQVTTGHVCQKPLDGDSARNHCHIIRMYRGPAHNVCNLNLRLKNKTTAIPTTFHNLRDYDFHLLLQAISNVKDRVICILNTTKKYISFFRRQQQFIDSVQCIFCTLLTSCTEEQVLGPADHYAIEA